MRQRAVPLLAGIVLFGVAYASLVATRYVLPLVDQLDDRTTEVPSG